MCLLKHWFAELEERGVKLDLVGLRYQTEAYLERVALFKGINSVTFNDRTSTNVRRLIEIRSLNDIGEVGPVATQIAAAIVNGMPDISFAQDAVQMHPSLREKMEETLQCLFSEILINGLEHERKVGTLYVSI